MVLTVIIRNPGPFIFLQEPCSHRTVHITLTEDQVAQISLADVGVDCGRRVIEEISSCYIEFVRGKGE